MNRLRSALVAASIVVSLIVSGTAPATADCDTQGPFWAPKGAAEGATFLGKVKARYKTENGRRAYRFKVLREYAGGFGPTTRVVLDCVDLTLPTGHKFLISSSLARPSLGTIHHLIYNDRHTVAWRVYTDGTVRLKVPDGGAPEAPKYLRRPGTLSEAVRVVTSS